MRLLIDTIVRKINKNLLVHYLEKECAHGWKCNGDDEQKPNHCISIHTIAEEYSLSKENHCEVDDNESDKTWMFPNP